MPGSFIEISSAPKTFPEDFFSDLNKIPTYLSYRPDCSYINVGYKNPLILSIKFNLLIIHHNYINNSGGMAIAL